MSQYNILVFKNPDRETIDTPKEIIIEKAIDYAHENDIELIGEIWVWVRMSEGELAEIAFGVKKPDTIH